MAIKKKSSAGKKVLVGAGIAVAAAAAGAGAYMLTGKKGAANRKKLKEFAGKAKGKMMEMEKKAVASVKKLEKRVS